MNTEIRKTNGGSSGTSSKIEGTQGVGSVCCRQKFPQVRKRQVCT